MKLGDIKAEALRLMFVNGSVDIAADNLVKYVGDDTYGHYLVNMPGAINRAFGNLERARVLPLRSCELITAAGVETARGVRFDMNVMVDDFYDAERLIKESGGSYDATADYMREEGIIYVEGFDTTAMYRLLYRPRMRRVNMGTPDDYEVEMPDHIAAIIPYAIKADLFRDDDPDESDRARRQFEEELAMLQGEVRGSHQGQVKTVYGGGMLL